VLNTQVPKGTTFDYVRISGTPGLGTCTTPPYQGTGQIVCHENDTMAANTTWTVRLTVKVTAPAGTVITENAATMADTPDPNLANNTATVSIKRYSESTGKGVLAGTAEVGRVHTTMSFPMPSSSATPNDCDGGFLGHVVVYACTAEAERLCDLPRDILYDLRTKRSTTRTTVVTKVQGLSL
jgi:hypothetical protein